MGVVIQCDVAPTEVSTTPYGDQKPGTSGVRKKTKTFMQPNYLENFVQATFNGLKVQPPQNPVAGGAMPLDNLIVSGDARFYSDVALGTCMNIAFANGVKNVVIGEGGLLSTPAVSALIRETPGTIFGAFILTASHNPGGLDNDFGIKYNGPTGGPEDSLYNVVHKNTLEIKNYALCKDFAPVISQMKEILAAKAGTVFTVGPDGADQKKITVVSSTAAHLDALKKIFDFEQMKKFVAHPKFSARFDCMNGAQGPYAQKILVEELGFKPESILRGTPMPDFGGMDAPHHGHADPNLIHAWDLVNKMGLDKTGKPIGDAKDFPLFGAAWDGDADRNMILGRQFFVIPSDSLAVLVDNCDEAVPFFRDNGGVKSAARSMPTSAALDVVCKAKGVELFETPTGWKFFGEISLELKRIKSRIYLLT